MPSGATPVSVVTPRCDDCPIVFCGVRLAALKFFHFRILPSTHNRRILPSTQNRRQPAKHIGAVGPMDSSEVRLVSSTTRDSVDGKTPTTGLRINGDNVRGGRFAP